MSFKGLHVKSIAQVAVETKEYIYRRAEGKDRSLRVRSNKINSVFMDGIDWNRIVTIAGLPGSGKTTLARQWVNEMIELNPEEQFDVLTFQFEMLGVDELAKDLSSKMDKSIKQIYSADGALSEKDLEALSGLLEKMKRYPIYIVDNMGTVSNIKDTIVSYVASNRLIERKRNLVVTLDHTLLVKPEEGDDEKATLDRLMHTLVELKKYLSSIGLKVIFIILSQLNRNLESPDRIMNKKLHYPNKNDIFGSSSVYYSSDYVIIVHRPVLIDGLGNWYGPEDLPVFNPNNPSQPMIYLHVIKERFGSTSIIKMLDELKRAKISDF